MDNLDPRNNNIIKANAPKPKTVPSRSAKAGHSHLVRNQINNFLNNYFHILTVVVVVAILFTGYKYLLLPKYQEVASIINTNNAEKRKLLSDKKRELEDLRKVVDVYRVLSPDDIKKFNDLIPAQYPKEELFTEMVYLVSKNGFTVDSVVVSNTSNTQKPNPEAPLASNTTRRRTDAVVATSTYSVPAPTISLPVGVERMYVKLDIGGVDYLGLRRLLSIFENNLRLIDISDFEYDPLAKTVSLKLQTYYFSATNK